MKVKVGDRVKFLNDTGSGDVTRIVDQKTALVQIDGGFEVPWLMSELVVASGSYGDEEEEVSVQTNKANQEPSFSEKVEEMPDEGPLNDEEVVLAFVPSENAASFSTYLINSSSYHIKYTIARKQEGEMILFHESTLEPGIKISLGSYQPGNLNDEEYFRVQAVFFNAGFYKHISPLDTLLTISAEEMYDSSNRKENDYFLEKAVLFTLYDWRKKQESPEITISAEELKKAMLTKGDFKSAKKVEHKPKFEEVDLHIEELVDDHRNMENAEIIDIQLARFRTALESAIRHKTRKIVFIHGVGNGKLKMEIRRLLDKEYRSKARYQDASFKEYGYGATMVLLK